MTYDKKIILIGTGGTIAGQGASETDLTGYTSGVLSLEAILAAVPGVDEYGPFEYHQFSNIESSDISEQQWIDLANLVQDSVERDDVEGIVITHGTDSMEETAFFLNLTVHTDKPVVVTGSMRPSGAVSADGPINLLQAMQIVRTPSSTGKGVLVALNGMIDGAREVTKTNTTDVSTFNSPLVGHLGIVQDGVAHFYKFSTRRHTNQSEFDCRQLNVLPKVHIIYCYAGIQEETAVVVLGTKPAGVILSGLGHGTIPQNIRNVTERINIPVVRASRTGSGIVSAVPTDKRADYLVSDSLNPQKARILLALGLTKTADRNELRRMFGEY